MKNILTFFLKAVLFCLLLWASDRLLGKIILHGIEQYYGLNDDADIVIIGPSQIMLGVDKVQLERETGLKVAKYTREGVTLGDRYAMIQHYFSTCSQCPKFLILNVDKYAFTTQGLSLNSYCLFFPFMSNSDMDSYVKKNASPKEYWSRHCFHTLRFDDLLLNHAIRGYLKKWDNLKVGSIKFDELERDIKNGKCPVRTVCTEEKEIRCFQDIINFLKSKNINVILLDITYAKPLEEYEPEATLAIRQTFLNAEKNNEKFYYLRLDEVSEHETWYTDMNHLNSTGQKEATSLLIKYLQSFDGNLQGMPE